METKRDTIPKKLKKKSQKNYIKTLDEKEQLAFKIAKSHLGSSFHLKKSVGYQQYAKQKIQQ